MAKSNAADLKRAAEIMADEEDPDLPPLESKAINPYKRAKPIAPVFAMAQAARKVSPTEAAQVAMKKNPVPMMAAALPAPRVLSLEKSFSSKNPFSGENYLQISCYNEIIRCHGDNNYKVPHLGKERLDRRGELPTVLPVIEEALDLL